MPTPTDDCLVVAAVVVVAAAATTTTAQTWRQPNTDSQLHSL